MSSAAFIGLSPSVPPNIFSNGSVKFVRRGASVGVDVDVEWSWSATPSALSPEPSSLACPAPMVWSVLLKILEPDVDANGEPNAPTRPGAVAAKGRGELIEPRAEPASDMLTDERLASRSCDLRVLSLLKRSPRAPY